jgi:hypothetical protein
LEAYKILPRRNHWSILTPLLNLLMKLLK